MGLSTNLTEKLHYIGNGIRVITYPLVNIQKANWNIAIEIVDLPIKNWRVSIVMLGYGYLSLVRYSRVEPKLRIFSNSLS